MMVNPRMTFIRGPILIPRRDGSVRFIDDGLIAGNDAGRIEWIGQHSHFSQPNRPDIRRAKGIICPPFFDDHIHIPQHPIRGRFMEGVGAHPAGGRLIAGLSRNVFPAESKCIDRAYTQQIVRDFLRDTLAKGVVGGAAYMTVHAAATRIALEILPASWSVGLVMMNQNCPDYLHSDEANFERDCEALARDFGRRFIPTDRFAVVCDTSLRTRGVEIARRFDLRMQTHLNEQITEKLLVENKLYPGQSYTGVYNRDGLLDCSPILAHCIQMTDAEFEIVARSGAIVAHCPTSNTLLGSGIMPLDRIIEHNIDYAICTDVGASPTTSMLHEMSQFLKVHIHRSKHATPSEALYRTTLAAARIIGCDDDFGSLEIGRPMSFVEIDCKPISSPTTATATADEAILKSLLELEANAIDNCTRGAMGAALERLAHGAMDACDELDLLRADVDASVRRLDKKVRRVTLAGMTVFGAGDS